MPRQYWVYDPHSGGVKIPERAKGTIEAQIRKYAAEHFAGRFNRLDIRFRGAFCYIDAYTEPDPLPEGFPLYGDESPEAHMERLRNTPTHLCRLRYFGGSPESWSFAFFSYASEKYEPACFPNGEFVGPAEEAFAVSAGAYL